MGGLGGARARHHPGHPAKRPEPRHALRPYERTKRLPVSDLNVALSRQSEGLSDAQAARNLKASVLAQLGNPEPNDIILELSDESYYLDATREWTFSQQAMQVVISRTNRSCTAAPGTGPWPWTRSSALHPRAPHADLHLGLEPRSCGSSAPPSG